MEKLILGLLMIRRATAYEIRAIIRAKFQGMCSDSLGGINTAMKKLLEARMITFKQFVEKGLNKKQFSITEAGREYFLQWLGTPADITRRKNMDFGKLFFMGFLPTDKRLPIIEEIIALLEREMEKLQNIHNTVNLEESKRQAKAYFENDKEYLQGVLTATTKNDITESIDEIADFQMLALQHDIDNVKFEIKWFKKLRDRIME